ncbi:phosphatase PAP2 family protein [Pelagibacterium xiamenense]|uniref:phosphatase PAP2 family protein n=1 Tax=Pelagibacterium xiamenense TaxID=2901140 RepID=UPI001E5CAF7D|nr:phosphatase PAP2 family protein [Pelagibacterium xiamenense]MCD7060875.1 phosphatase PAP2 family protein [Pelagibacterium xiamenense]
MRVWRNLRARNSKRRLLVLWPVAGLLALLLIAILFDRSVSLTLQNWPAYELAIFAFITDFGTSGWILYPTLLGMIGGYGLTHLPLTYSWHWAARALAAISFYVFASVGISGLVTVFLKRLIGRGRPLYIEDHGILYFNPLQLLDWRLHSFPSGHATTAMAFSVVLVTILNGRYRIALFGMGLAIGLSRIVVGDHYLSDVIGGTTVGTLSAILIRDFFATRNWSMRLEQGQVRFRMLAGFRPLWRRLRRGHIPAALK